MNTATGAGRRVAIVSDAEPERNGVGTYYRDLADHLAVRARPVTYLGPGHGEPPLPHWLSLPLPGDATQRLGVPSPVALARRLRAECPDTVVIATPGPYGLMAARTARALGARVVFGLHTHYEALSALYWRGLQRRMNHWALTTVNRRLIGSADVVIANSRRMCDLARRLGAGHARLVGTLLPPAFLARPAVPLAGELRSVLFVGRLAAEKRVGTVITAAERLPALDFHLVGDGPERAAVRAAAGRLPNLRWTGWLPRAGIIDALDAADLLVLPSAVEAFGTVALEALARGRPTLVSRGCGIRDWPGLAPGLHLIGGRETTAAAIARVAALDPAVRRRRAGLGRAGAARLNAGSLGTWLAVLDGDAAAAAATGEP